MGVSGPSLLIESTDSMTTDSMISIGRAIGGMAFVRCTEVVRFSESPLLEVSL